ncbi:LolA family protein [Marinobacterium lutimaris]|uniref:Outer membrane lipoprotein-sorting protein n=1 Tax=Marinobacterium lutimaris TaxID=568106 RepID=A0A1H5TBU4_9GAMM|nr:outer membrane lipoprotein carrier protein LolA [Marinobacterium lutimaris]SEF60259.1 Outer membrane lipoprotein-sorting protein [Marinobacterium lutimaris]
MKRFLLICLLLCLPSLSHALDFEELGEYAESPETLKGEFTQTRFLKSLDASITSTGTFSYEKGGEIRWTTLEPLASELILTPEGIHSDDGSLPEDKTPVMKMISDIFFALLSADWEALEQHFRIEGELVDNRWQVVLFPREETLASAIQQIDLAGGRYLTAMDLHEAGGDVVHIELSDLQP